MLDIVEYTPSAPSGPGTSASSPSLYLCGAVSCAYTLVMGLLFGGMVAVLPAFVVSTTTVTAVALS